MRVMEYAGKPERIGRFGRVKTGELLEMTEQEANEALRSDQWTAVDSPHVEAEDHDIPRPRKTKEFDLTTVDWANHRLSRHLSRQSRTTLWKMAKAVEEVTGRNNIPYGPMESSDRTIDGICEAARLMKWTA
jgi:hypothetical protein